MDRVKELVHTKETYRCGLSGRGVRIALLDTGVSNHPGLKGKVIAFRDFVNGREQPYDDNGHGTHIAGILCGKNTGIAPGAELIVCKILDSKGNGGTKTALEALKWIGKQKEAYRIRLLNFSMGYLPDVRRREQQLLLDAVDCLWDEGIAIVTAAGNNGPGEGSVTVPGISRNVITVGAGDGYSGSGPTACCIVKPEILAPGTDIKSLDYKSDGYALKSGTSMAAPIVCGALALALEKDPALSPMLLKLALYESVDREPAEMLQSCWGKLNVDRLMEMI